MQRDCEVVIENMDRGGTFLGTINILGASPQAKAFNLPLGESSPPRPATSPLRLLALASLIAAGLISA